MERNSGADGLTHRIVGLQLMAIILANGSFCVISIWGFLFFVIHRLFLFLSLPDFKPYDPVEDKNLREETLFQVLTENLASSRKTLYAPSAEVLGMILAANTKDKTTSRAEIHKKHIEMVKANLTALFKKNAYEGLSVFETSFYVGLPEISFWCVLQRIWYVQSRLVPVLWRWLTSFRLPFLIVLLSTQFSTF
jgi:hypothetical protein